MDDRIDGRDPAVVLGYGHMRPRQVDKVHSPEGCRRGMRDIAAGENSGDMYGVRTWQRVDASTRSHNIVGSDSRA